MINFLYSKSYENNKKIDEDYIEESNIISQNNFFVTENHKKIIPNSRVLYRGWMLSKNDYSEMEENINKQDAKLIVSINDYYASHYIDNWYDILKDLTPKTIILKRENFQEKLKEINIPWKKSFVKDSVKSLTTQRGSIARNKEDIVEIIGLIHKYRGEEGNVVIREAHDFDESTEIRYFCINGYVYSPDSYISPIAKEVGNRMKHLPFISIDIIKDYNGKEWLVEIGDGQVSDYKMWNLKKYCDLLTKLK